MRRITKCEEPLIQWVPKQPHTIVMFYPLCQWYKELKEIFNQNYIIEGEGIKIINTT